MEEVTKENGSPSGSSPENSPSGEGHTGSPAANNPEAEALEALRKEKERLLSEVTQLRTERRTLKGDTSPTQTSVPDTQTNAKVDPVSAAAERRALRIFMEKHPEYADPTKWGRLQDTYVSRRGKILWEDIIEDFEDAHYLMNREEIIREEAKRNSNQAVAKVFEGSRADIGGTSSVPPTGSNPKEGLTEEERKIFTGLQKADPSLTEEKYLEAKKKRSQK